MELIVFDLDGTLLNKSAAISAYTRETLERLAERGIAYTVATGRTLHAAQPLLEGHGFHLPQIFKNGVMIWQPDTERFTHQNTLTLAEVDHVLTAVMGADLTPFIFTIEPGNRHAIYHPPPGSDAEQRLAADFAARSGITVLPAARLPAEAQITNISALGAPVAILDIERQIADEPHLVAYAGAALEGPALRWLDIHHSDASKGAAVDLLRETLGVTRVICFGDSDNDLSMFARADESYAPANALAEVQAAATAVIGHHDEDGVARFLRQRFRLD